LFEGTIGGALLAAARRHADRPALVARSETLTYRQLFERALGIAFGLRALDLRSGDRVAFLAQRDATAYASLLGVLIAGGAYVPLNTRFPAQRNAAILRSSEARAVILDANCAESLESLLGELPAGLAVVTPESGPTTGFGAHRRIDSGQVAPRSLEGERHCGGLAADPAYLMFTSGTTGAPKGVPISHANLAAYLAAMSQVFSLTTEDRVLQAVDLTFDLSVHDMMFAWLAGATLYVLPENATILAPRIIAEQAITACQLVPSAAAQAVQRGLLRPGELPSLRVSMFGGEALPLSVAQAWREAAPDSRLLNCYGPTEATIHTSVFEFTSACPTDYPVVPIGSALDGQQIEICDSAGAQLDAGETGEIWLAGRQITEGYWRAPQIDAEKFVTLRGHRWYKTGDLGRLVEPHGVVFAGRADRQVKLRGYRVELQEIEGAVRKASARSEVAVIAWPINDGGTADGCVAFVADVNLDAPEALARCRRLLPPYMTPDRIVLIDAIPLNQNGKTDYNRLAAHPALRSPEAARPVHRSGIAG
jgi:amino acid adenylation domain-containing protein